MIESGFNLAASIAEEIDSSYLDSLIDTQLAVLLLMFIKALVPSTTLSSCLDLLQILVEGNLRLC